MNITLISALIYVADLIVFISNVSQKPDWFGLFYSSRNTVLGVSISARMLYGFDVIWPGLTLCGGECRKRIVLQDHTQMIYSKDE